MLCGWFVHELNKLQVSYVQGISGLGFRVECACVVRTLNRRHKIVADSTTFINSTDVSTFTRYPSLVRPHFPFIL